jgi:phosphoenolpyruvate synthase/pyruvate phosphate dikinase
MSEVLVLPLAKAKDVSLVGGKASSLGNLLRNGFTSLDGFVITTSAFGHMSKELERSILECFDRLGCEYVAVRSSAAAEDSKDAAWAGQLDTFLNVSRNGLIEVVKKSWESINSDRAKSYSVAKNVQAGQVAVIVQPMVQSDVAGVAFSAHPVTQNKDQIIIEAGIGLGEAVVSGEITPDTYIIDKNSGKILKKHIANQTKRLIQGESGKNEWQQVVNGKTQKLSDSKIIELAQTVVKIERFYKFAVDTEWMMKDDVLIIMQSRPITNLG